MKAGSTATSSAIPRLVSQNMDLFACPACAAPVRVAGDGFAIQCSEGRHSFQSEDGIPLMFWPNQWDAGKDVTETVRSFYEENPFPNYENVDSEWSLREKAKQGRFARLLDEQIRHGSRVLEVGCGTGQLSNFLGLRWGRKVFGADICLNSLKLGQAFKHRNQVDNVAFVQMNLFRPVFRPESFDLVICNGVLHHTSDPFLGFRSISRLTRKGGWIIIGLYNTYGRILTDIRRLIFRLSGNRFRFLDSRLRNNSIGETRRNTWFMDQYRNPHESKHTIGEVVKWFELTGFEFVNSIPKATASASFVPDERLFAANPKGTRLDHAIVQGAMLLSGGSEGGFFVMIGRRRP